MINKDKIDVFNIDKTFEANYLKIFAIIEKMEEIFKGTSFDEYDILEANDKKTAIELINDVINEFISLSRKSSGKIFWEKFKENWNAPDFWDAVMKKTKSESEDFIKMELWRNMEEDRRNDLFQKIFKYKYIEKEDREFISEKLDLDKIYVESFLDLLKDSEQIIFLYSLPKRRYIGLLENKFGIDNSDIMKLWDLYETNQELIEKLVSKRVNSIILHRLENLEKKINALQK